MDFIRSENVKQNETQNNTPCAYTIVFIAIDAMCLSN